MCVTRHSRRPPSARVDIFVNTSAIYGALHFIWHFALQCCTPPPSTATTSFIHEGTFT